MSAARALLVRAYKEFYELPWKSAKQFDIMDDVAAYTHAQTTPPEERGEKLVEKFYDAFHYSARTDAQKKKKKKIMEEMLERIFS
jgi:hypothetical protein